MSSQAAYKIILMLALAAVIKIVALRDWRGIDIESALYLRKQENLWLELNVFHQHLSRRYPTEWIPGTRATAVFLCVVSLLKFWREVPLPRWLSVVCSPFGAELIRDECNECDLG